MPVSAATLRRVASMPPEAMAEMLLILADQEDAEEQRRAKQRERTKRHRDNNVTVTRVSRHDNGDSNASPAPKKVSPTPPSKITPSPDVSPNGDTTARDFFEEFWSVYPKRDGDNPKKPAKLKFERAVAKGASPDDLIAEAKRLAARHPVPTSFVPQAVTWLHQERWLDEHHDPPLGQHVNGGPHRGNGHGRKQSGSEQALEELRRRRAEREGAAGADIFAGATIDASFERRN